MDEALSDDVCIIALHEEHNQFQINDVGDLVPRTISKHVIGTKWVFKNILNEQGEVLKNKARLVAQDSSLQEGNNFAETHTPVARLKAIRQLLSHVVNLDIIIHRRIDVKSGFLNRVISEELYVKQPLGFAYLKQLEYVLSSKSHGMV